MSTDTIKKAEEDMEKFVLDIPQDFEERIYSVTPPEMHFYATEIVNYVKYFQKDKSKKPNAQMVWAGCIAVIGRMLKSKFPHPQILGAINIAPKYFDILMPNEWVSNGAKMLFEHEMAPLKAHVS